MKCEHLMTRGKKRALGLTCEKFTNFQLKDGKYYCNDHRRFHASEEELKTIGKAGKINSEFEEIKKIIEAINTKLDSFNKKSEDIKKVEDVGSVEVVKLDEVKQEVNKPVNVTVIEEKDDDNEDFTDIETVRASFRSRLSKMFNPN